MTRPPMLPAFPFTIATLTPAPVKRTTGYVEWDARCPHGVDARWTAVRTDTRSSTICHCPCAEEEAA